MSLQDLERIRFVTRHYRELQGLKVSVPLGLVFLGLGLDAIHPIYGFRAAVVLDLGAFCLFLWARSFYRRRLGVVERRKTGAPRRKAAERLSALLLLAFFLAMEFDLGHLGRSYLYLFLGSMLLGEWLSREHALTQGHLPILGVLLFALAASSRSAASDLPILATEGCVDILCGATWILVGLLDHRQLVKAMGPLAASGPEAAAAAEERR